jgi:hypothetical protein
MQDLISNNTLNKFYLVDTIVEDMCSMFCLIVFIYAGFKIRSNRSKFIIAVWLLFLLNVLFYTIYEFTYSITNRKAKDLLSATFNMFQILALWTFSFHYYNSAVNATKILLEGIHNYSESPLKKRERMTIYWIVFFAILLQFFSTGCLQWVRIDKGKSSSGVYHSIFYIFDGGVITLVLLVALNKI